MHTTRRVATTRRASEVVEELLDEVRRHSRDLVVAAAPARPMAFGALVVLVSRQVAKLSAGPATHHDGPQAPVDGRQAAAAGGAWAATPAHHPYLAVQPLRDAHPSHAGRQGTHKEVRRCAGEWHHRCVAGGRSLFDVLEVRQVSDGELLQVDVEDRLRRLRARGLRRPDVGAPFRRTERLAVLDDGPVLPVGRRRHSCRRIASRLACRSLLLLIKAIALICAHCFDFGSLL